MEAQICSALGRKEREELWELEQKILTQLKKMEKENREIKRQEVTV